MHEMEERWRTWPLENPEPHCQTSGFVSVILRGWPSCFVWEKKLCKNHNQPEQCRCWPGRPRHEGTAQSIHTDLLHRKHEQRNRQNAAGRRGRLWDSWAVTQQFTTLPLFPRRRFGQLVASVNWPTRLSRCNAPPPFRYYLLWILDAAATVCP